MSDAMETQTLSVWLIDVTRCNPLLLGPYLPGNDPDRPTEAYYRAERARIVQEGGPLRAIPGSGRPAEEDERIQRALEIRPPLSPVLHQNFDDGTWSSLNGLHMPATAAVIQRDVVRVGTRALQVTLKSSDNPPRAQLRDPYNAPFGRDTWYGFSIRLPVAFAPGESVVLAQWCDQAAPGQKSGKKPPMAIRYEDGGIRISGAHGDAAKPGKPTLHTIKTIEKDIWLDFKFKVVWEQDGQTTVTGFLNGEQIFEHDGPLGYPGRDLGPYFMLGLKTDSVSEDKPLTAYFDNYSRGQSGDEVDPALSHSDAPPRA